MTSFFSLASKKAWLAGVLSALLTPLLNLLTGTDVLNLRSLLIAVISGIIAAAAVWATGNAKSGELPPSPPTGEPVTPAAGVVPATRAAAANVGLDDEFAGQTVDGE